MRLVLSILKFVIFFEKLSKANKRAFNAWWRREFSSPAPHFIKMRILGSIFSPNFWVETGTHYGDTTKFLAEKFPGSEIISIEPSPEIFDAASRRLLPYQNVEIICGTSESVLETILDRLSIQPAPSVAFWLDGHYSGGATFLGAIETPIKFELELIAKYLKCFSQVHIFIDDFRLFVSQVENYPPTEFLSDWAKSNGLSWSVEHDIFIIHN